MRLAEQAAGSVAAAELGRARAPRRRVVVDLVHVIAGAPARLGLEHDQICQRRLGAFVPGWTAPPRGAAAQGRAAAGWAGYVRCRRAVRARDLQPRAGGRSQGRVARPVATAGERTPSSRSPRTRRGHAAPQRTPQGAVILSSHSFTLVIPNNAFGIITVWIGLDPRGARAFVSSISTVGSASRSLSAVGRLPAHRPRR